MSADLEKRLRKELERLKAKLKLGYELDVKLDPGQTKYDERGRRISAEVIGITILIYERDEAEALSALRHEFIDYALTKSLVEPLVDLINLLIKALEESVAKEKERLVEGLSKLI